MNLRFHVDPDSGLPHIYDHNVSEREVVEALSSAGEDIPGRGDSRVAIGQTRTGRYLRVIYVPGEDGDAKFIVTAYDVPPKQIAAYRRRKRRRQ
jgi:hypothetical protein